MDDIQSITTQALRNPHGALLELDRLDCEGSLLRFAQSGWRYIDPKPFVNGWHLEAVAEHLEAVTWGQIPRLLINIPPRMTKSLMVSVSWPAWTWAQRDRGDLSGPQVQFLTTSYSSALSTRDSVRCRRLIQSPWYQARWGSRFDLTGDQNAKQRFENSEGGYRLATSVGSMLTGEGGDVIVADDPHNAIEIESEAVIEATTQWWDESLSTRLNDPKTGAFVVIMQRLSTKDISGHILSQNRGEWTHLCLPMEYDPRFHCVTNLPWEDPRTRDGELLAPERYDEVSLAELKHKLGPFGTAGQLQQRPVPRGGGIIKSDWWETWPPEGERRDAHGRVLNPLAYPEMKFIVASLDTAMTAKEENDYSAMTVWGVWYNEYDMPQIMLMEAWAERLEFHELVQRTITTCSKRRIDRLLIEAKNNGFSVAQEIRRRVSHAGYSVHLERVRGDKVARAHSVVALFAAGQVWAPDRRWAQRVIDDCADFPRGEHDDLVDSMTQALNHLRKSAILETAAERQDAIRAGMVPYNEQHPQVPYEV